MHFRTLVDASADGVTQVKPRPLAHVTRMGLHEDVFQTNIWYTGPPPLVTATADTDALVFSEPTCQPGGVVCSMAASLTDKCRTVTIMIKTDSICTSAMAREYGCDTDYRNTTTYHSVVVLPCDIPPVVQSNQLKARLVLDDIATDTTGLQATGELIDMQSGDRVLCYVETLRFNVFPVTSRETSIDDALAQPGKKSTLLVTNGVYTGDAAAFGLNSQNRHVDTLHDLKMVFPLTQAKYGMTNLTYGLKYVVEVEARLQLAGVTPGARRLEEDSGLSVAVERFEVIPNEHNEPHVSVSGLESGGNQPGGSSGGSSTDGGNSGNDSTDSKESSNPAVWVAAVLGVGFVALAALYVHMNNVHKKRLESLRNNPNGASQA